LFAVSAPVPDIDHHADAMHRAGAGVLEVSRVHGRSVITRAFATSPLRLLMPRNRGSAAWVFTSTYGGGLLGGDDLEIDAVVRERAHALLLTQASTKVYRSSRSASARLTATVEDGGLLCVMPDPVVCFAGSTYRQTQQFDLRGTAGLLLVDWLSSGRSAFGERWAFDDYSARVSVRVDGRLVMIDATSLRAAEGDLASRLGRFEAICFVALLGPRVGEAAARAVEEIARMPVRRNASVLMGAAPLGEGGCVVRLAGTSLQDVARTARGFLQFVPTLLGDDPWARKW
jgi:urease accessory protein